VELRSSSVVRCRIRRRLIARKSRFSCKQHAIRIAWLRDSRLGAACIGSHQRAAPASAAKSTAESFGRPTRGRQAEYRCWLCIAVRGDLQRIGKRILPQRRGWEKSSRQQPRLAGFLSFDPSSAFFAPMLFGSSLRAYARGSAHPRHQREPAAWVQFPSTPDGINFARP
jgi:hypothetical protein